jgi:uncharacterized membrane protein
MKQKTSVQILEMFEIIKQLQTKILSMEERLQKIESKLEGAASVSGQIAPKGFDEGVWVSNSNAPVSLSVNSNLMLSPVDEQILKIVRERGAVCAEDIRQALKYKGQNAASARLARLASLNILKKYQAGRRVYYKF